MVWVLLGSKRRREFKFQRQTSGRELKQKKEKDREEERKESLQQQNRKTDVIIQLSFLFCRLEDGETERSTREIRNLGRPQEYEREQGSRDLREHA